MTPLDRLRALHAAVLATGQPLNPRYAMGKLIACVDALRELLDQAYGTHVDGDTIRKCEAALAPLVKEEP